MGEIVKMVTEILSTVLPDSDLGKVVTLLMVLLFFLILSGRLRLEWIGSGVRHIYRWFRCKVRDKHLYHLNGIGWVDINTGRQRGTFVCNICGKVTVQR